MGKRLGEASLQNSCQPVVDITSRSLFKQRVFYGRFGIDLHTPAFWQSSFAVMRQEIDHFQALVEDRNA